MIATGLPAQGYGVCKVQATTVDAEAIARLLAMAFRERNEYVKEEREPQTPAGSKSLTGRTKDDGGGYYHSGKASGGVKPKSNSRGENGL
jgi:hypothetical protein